MIQFYAPEVKATGMLPESESAHCCRVVRMREGDEISVVDGKGSRFRCLILSTDPRHTAVEILSKEEIAKTWRGEITLAVAPTKNSDRMEWLLEKVVEMGVDRIVLLKCRRSERKGMKTERLVKVMVSAMKQSLKAHLPELVEMTDFESYVASVPTGVQKLFGYCDENYERREFVDLYRPDLPVVVMIGPEGDFSPEEVDAAMEAGFIPVTFGESRLRTETAGLYAVAAVHVLDRAASR